MNLLSEFPYGTFSNYSPRGQSELSKKSRLVRDAIKSGQHRIFDRVAELIEQHPEWPIADFFGQDVMLTPVPGSALSRLGDLWVPKLICERFVARGLGADVFAGLQRTAAVPKSAFAAPGQRPTVSAHYLSMQADPGLFAPAKITLVDDVLTCGRTSFAAAWRLHEAYPNVEIRIFAVIRTQGYLPDIAALKDPCAGIIRLNAAGTDVTRIP